MAATSGSAMHRNCVFLTRQLPQKGTELSNSLTARTSAYRRLWLETAFEEADRIPPRKSASRQRRGPLLGPGQAPRIWSETERVRGPSNSARMILCQVPRTS